MKHILFGDFPDGLVILSNALNTKSIQQAYLDPYQITNAIAIELFSKPGSKTTPIKDIRAYLTHELVPVLIEQDCQYILCTDPTYFKELCNVQQADAYIGYVLPCAYLNCLVAYAPTYKSIFYDPVKAKSRIAQSMSAILAHKGGSYSEHGANIVHQAQYLTSAWDIAKELETLLAINQPLTCDIETYSLNHWNAGIGSIAFGTSKHAGIVIAVDHPHNQPNEPVRQLLKQFFNRFQNTLIFHNMTFDATVLIYQLYMKDLLDTEGMYQGIQVILKNWDDTKLISYLATNSCSGNDLSLKTLAQPFAGNYAIDITDISTVDSPTLLHYNLMDALATWFVYDTYYPKMVQDNQEEIYTTLFKDAAIDIVQMQLTGMPVNMSKVLQIEQELTLQTQQLFDRIQDCKYVQEFIQEMNEQWVTEKNLKLKKKQVTIADAEGSFNPDSAPQLSKLLFEKHGLPILETTATGNPATGGDELKQLQSHCTDPILRDLLDTLVQYKLVSKITTTFVPALKNAQLAPDGWHYLFGNFNLGGTVSGRLSSSAPNLQNLPAKSKYGKLIKECFQAPPGWVFAGLDFASLEDRISALTTKDPNKLKTYTDGYDGHSYRAYSYFHEQMPDIDPTKVESINSIATKYPKQRQDSKAPTFALTYQGTPYTLEKNCGFTPEVAKQIFDRYHDLYSTSTAWVNQKLDQAGRDGYVTGAFGLRVRTPLLQQVIRGVSKTPREAEAEGRTAGNALGQSWCLLNSRAWSAAMKRCRASKHALDIRLCAQIHDAGYVLVRDDVDAILFLNDVIVEEVNWNQHPDIYHPDVGLGGELSLFHPTWNQEITVPNQCTASQLYQLIKESQ